jgi:hypothetical protein
MVAYSFAHVGQLVNVDTPRVRRLFLAGYPQDLVIAPRNRLMGLGHWDIKHHPDKNKDSQKPHGGAKPSQFITAVK